MIIFKPIYNLLLCAFYFYANCQDDLPPQEPDVPVKDPSKYANRRTPITLEKDDKYEMIINDFSVDQFKPKLFIRTDGKVKIQIGIDNDNIRHVTVDKNMEL